MKSTTQQEQQPQPQSGILSHSADWRDVYFEEVDKPSFDNSDVVAKSTSHLKVKSDEISGNNGDSRNKKCRPTSDVVLRSVLDKSKLLEKSHTARRNNRTKASEIKDAPRARYLNLMLSRAVGNCVARSAFPDLGEAAYRKDFANTETAKFMTKMEETPLKSVKKKRPFSSAIKSNSRSLHDVEDCKGKSNETTSSSVIAVPVSETQTRNMPPLSLRAPWTAAKGISRSKRPSSALKYSTTSLLSVAQSCACSTQGSTPSSFIDRGLKASSHSPIASHFSHFVFNSDGSPCLLHVMENENQSFLDSTNETSFCSNPSFRTDALVDFSRRGGGFRTKISSQICSSVACNNQNFLSVVSRSATINHRIEQQQQQQHAISAN